MMRAGTLFSGIGAPECAAGDIDWRWSCEIDPFASAVHKARFPGVTNLGDITTVDWHATEPVDLVVGGPPCQAYSVAGNRGSLDDPRGDLTLRYGRTLDAIDPAWSVTENVPGWLSTPDNAFGAFLGILVGADAPLVPGRGQRWTDAGVVSGPVRTAAWRILDAQFHGVPQRRRRVFVVACRGAGNWACAAALFPVGEGVRRDLETREEARQAIAGSLGSGSPRSGKRLGRREAAANHLIAGSFEQNSMAGRGTLGWSNGDAPLRPVKPQSNHQFIAFGGNNTAGPIDLATACNAHGGPHGRLDFESETFVAQAFYATESRCDNIPPPGISPPLKVGSNGGGQPPAIVHSVRADGFDASEGGAKSNSLRMWETAGTLEANRVQAMHSAMSVRRLTPVECERLQGFPDGWTEVPHRGKPAADGPRYRAIGNSMAVPCVGWVLSRVAAVYAAANAVEEAAA